MTMSRRLSLALSVISLVWVATTANAQQDDKLSLLQLTDNGYVDTSYGTAGRVIMHAPGGAEDWIYDIVRTGGGKLAVCGTATINGKRTFLVGRFNSNGTPDTTFSSDGFATPSWISTASENAYAITERQNNIVAAGSVQATGGEATMNVARFNIDGTLDSTFGTGGLVSVAWPGWNVIAGEIDVKTMRDSGRVVIGATLRSTTSVDTRFGIARLNSNGTLDTTFSGDGLVTVLFPGLDEVHARSLSILYGTGKTEATARIAFGGSFTQSGDKSVLIVMLKANGDMDTSFDGDGRKIFTFPTGPMPVYSALPLMEADSLDRLVVGADSPYGVGVARVLPTGAMDMSFHTDGFNNDFSPLAGGWSVLGGLAIEHGSDDIVLVSYGVPITYPEDPEDALVVTHFVHHTGFFFEPDVFNAPGYYGEYVRSAVWLGNDKVIVAGAAFDAHP